MMKNKSFGLWLIEWALTYKIQYKNYKNISINIRLHVPQWLKDIPLKEITALERSKGFKRRYNVTHAP